MELHDVVATTADLRALYREPSATAANKVRDCIDAESARFIAASPFVLLATASRDGRCDVSPRGGPPGFVTALDDRHLAVPDLGGNNRLDSYTNLVENPRCGLLFVVPGSDDTVRVNGAAKLARDARVVEACTKELRPPKLVVVVEVEELFVHCAKSFRRARLWDAAARPEPGTVPDLADIYACQLGIDAARKRADLERVYEASLADDRV